MKTTLIWVMEVILKGISLERIWKLKIRLQRISGSFWVHYVIRQFMRMYSMSKFLNFFFFQLASHATLQICTIFFYLLGKFLIQFSFLSFLSIKINHHTSRNFFISTFFSKHLRILFFYCVCFVRIFSLQILTPTH